MYELMIDSHFALNHFEGALGSLLAMIALCTLRFYAAFMVLPATNDQVIQGAVRNGLCLMLGFFVAWGQPAHDFAGFSPPMLVLLLLKEALLGVVLGFPLSTVLWVAESAGAFIDNSAGFNNVQQTNPLSGQQSTPVSNLMAQLVIASFYMLGGMLVCVSLLFESLSWWPVIALTPPLGDGLERFLSSQVHGYYATAVKLAAPVLLVVVLIDLSFGLLGKTADKLTLLVTAFFEQARPAIALHDLKGQLSQWAAALGPGKVPPPAAPR